MEMSTFRTRSLPVDVVSHSSPTTPTRATFPFKPASTLIALQQSQTISSANSSSRPCFRLRPVIPALSLQLQPRRCASFPALESERRLYPLTDVPDWLISTSREKIIALFPVAIHLPKDSDCWWLKLKEEMASIAKGRLSTIVQVREDEIELVDSEEESSEIIDIIEDVQIDGSSATGKGPSQHAEATEIVGSIDGLGSASEEAAQSKAAEQNIATTEKVTPELSASSLKKSDDRQQQQYPPEEMRILQEKVKDLRNLETLLQRVEGAMKIDAKIAETTVGVESCCAVDDDKNKAQPNEPAPSALDHIRRTAVGITGGALTVAGVALIPCPIIPGCLVVYGGLLVLATEFEAAKKALDAAKEPLEQWLADDEEGNSNESEDGEVKYNSDVWGEMIGFKSDELHGYKKDIDDEFKTMIDPMTSNSVACPDNEDSNKSEKGSSNNKAMKKFLRTILGVSKETDIPIDEIDESTPSGSCGNDQSKPTCDSDLPGCKFLPFAFDEDDSNADMTDGANERIHNRRHVIDFDRMCSVDRTCSNGSITLNTLNDCDDTTIRLFSRGNTAGSSHCNDNDCILLQFGCNSLLDEGQLRCQIDAIEKK